MESEQFQGENKMAVYLMNYEINFIGRRLARAKRNKFRNFLDSYNNIIQISPDTLLISTEDKLDEISNRFESILEDTDRLFLVEITNHYCGELSDEEWNWLDQEFGNEETEQ